MSRDANTRQLTVCGNGPETVSNGVRNLFPGDAAPNEQYRLRFQRFLADC